MKTQEQAKRLLMWYKVKELSEENSYSCNKIAGILGIDRRTVSRYLSMSEGEFIDFISKPRVYKRLLSVYHPDVKKMLKVDQDLPAAVIEDRLQEKYPDFPPVCSKTVYNFVQHVRYQEGIFPREKIRQTEVVEETGHGEQAQVDFGESILHRVDGTRKKVFFIAFILSRSRYKYVFFSPVPFTGRSVAEAHEKAFAYFQGIPRHLVYDQDRVLISNENLGDYILAGDFARYRDERDLNIKFCRKADPQSKGKVENLIGHVKKNFLRSRVFHDIDRLNDEVLEWLDRRANGTKHHATAKIPKEEWLIEKQHLLPYRALSRGFSSGEQLAGYTVRKDNSISYKGNLYRVPYGTYSGRGSKVLLEKGQDHISLFDSKGVLLVKHPICLEQGKTIGESTYRKERGKRMEQMKQQTVSLLPASSLIGDYLDRLYTDKPRYFKDNVDVIRKVISRYDPAIVEQALDYCHERMLYNGFSVLEAAEHFRETGNYLGGGENEAKAGSSSNSCSLAKYNVAKYNPSRSNILQYEQIIR